MTQPASQGAVRRNRWILVIGLLTIAVGVAFWILSPSSVLNGLIPSATVRVILALAIVSLAGYLVAEVLNLSLPPAPGTLDLIPPEEYSQQGVGPCVATADGRTLYLDLMKRTLSNIIYEDQPYSFYDDERRPVIADRFRLDRRVQGEDAPREAHTMVGIPRLNNLQQCVETILAEQVPGDLLEAGVLRGGASIFLRAVLKAHQVTDRSIIACDTFRPTLSQGRTVFQDLLLRFLSVIASLPNKRVHRALYELARKIPPEKRSFPIAETPSDEVIECTMFILRHARELATVHKDQTGVEAVKSHFARYGLLDDQVRFLEGFFSDTLPDASLKQLALIRLDGDLYESTRDALIPLYPKLSPGGFCIVDDYYAFTDCQRAVDEYRAAHNITAELVQIDKLAVYWRKPRD